MKNENMRMADQGQGNKQDSDKRGQQGGAQGSPDRRDEMEA